MFDKNIFKEEFRLWSEQFPFASMKEVENFCDFHIPPAFKNQYSWLIEQSISWFLWRQEKLQIEILQEAESVLTN